DGDDGGADDIANDGLDAVAASISKGRAAQRVLLPITDDAVTVLAMAVAAQTPAAGGGGAKSEMTALLERTGAQLLRTPLPSSKKAPISPAQRLRDSVAALLRIATDIPVIATETKTAAPAVPLLNVPGALVSELLADLPSRWERLGDLVLLPAGSLAHQGWVTALAAVAAVKGEAAVTAVGPDVLLPLWRVVAEALGVKRLARQAAVANTGTRDSRAVLLLGADGWVSHREGGVTFHLDVTRCMFSSGNVTERTRMGWGRGLRGAPLGMLPSPPSPPSPPLASAPASASASASAPPAAAAPVGGGCGGRPGWAAGETIVDLYCGIGYYTVPLLVVAGAAKVYACEWNPHAQEALTRNLQQPPLPAAAAAIAAALSATGVPATEAAAAAAAPVSSRCEVLAGDCRLRAPAGVADRVLLGLLPSSRGGWEAAIRALRPCVGGWLHLHHNVTDSEEAQWLSDTMDELRRLAVAAGRDWQLRLHHVEKVKWYAPRILHIVMDIECRPLAAAALSSGMSQSNDPDPDPDPGPGPGPGRHPATGTSRHGVGTVTVTVTDSSAITTVCNAGAIGTANTATDATRSPTTESSLASENGLAAAPRWYEQPYDVLPHVRRVRGVQTREAFERDISPGRKPVILEGQNLGPAPGVWTPEYLMNLPAAKSTLVSVHVSREPHGRLDFVNKNFAFRIMTLAELVARMTGVTPTTTTTTATANNSNNNNGNNNNNNGNNDNAATTTTTSAAGAVTAEAIRGVDGPRRGEAGSGWPELVPRGEQYGDGPEVLYLRSIGGNPRREPANLAASFPSLAPDLTLPPLFDPARLHSSVLRMSSPDLVLWTHYDVMDNLLVQVRGNKRVLLWPPACHDALHVEGSSSPITRLHCPDLRQYPRFADCPAPLVADLGPGDVLFLPSLWFHNVTTIGSEMSISVNVFWRHLAPEFYHRKDLYGNRDLVQAEEADRAVDQALAQLTALPSHYREFYGARLLGKLRRQLGLK
ncbi:hypothetical protein VaNZ11_011895, partial [Volvox africanus]